MARGDEKLESKYSIDTSEALVRLQVSGEIRAHEFIKLMAQIGADPRHRPDMACIADLREAYGEWDYSEIQRFRDYVVHIAGTNECRWAAVVNPGSLAAIAHLLIIISDSATQIRMQLFEEPRTALKWVRKAAVVLDCSD